MISPDSYSIKATCQIFLYILVFITGAWGDCTAPENIQFAEQAPDTIDKNSFIPGTVVTYTCQPGYTRLPGSKSSRTCLPDNTWSQLDVFCRRRTCGNPGEILNGDIEATDFLFGSKVIFKCHDGYRLTTKRNYRDCLADGTWSNDQPECEAVICPAPDAPPNGSHDPHRDEYNYLDAVTFSCNKDLELDGESTVSCTADGSWSSSSPTCVAVTCSDPYVPNSRRLSGFVGPYSLNFAVRFECMDDYAMNGSSSITCKINSQWDPKVPECLTYCNPPPPALSYAELDEGFAHLPNYFSGTTVQYHCKEGYERDLNKENTIPCRDKHWDVSDNFCTRKSCGSPGEIMNANMSAPDFLFGSRVTYRCNEGYLMTSAVSYSDCQADGTWSRAVVVCTGVCGSPPKLSYAKLDKKFVHLPNYVSGTIVLYNCIPGYKRDPNKENNITCSDKNWSKIDQFCSRKSCGDPGQIRNADRFDPSDFLFGSNATYTCKEGYAMTSETYRECQADGTWSRPDLTCAGVCKFPPPTLMFADLDGRFANLPNYFNNTTVQYNCKESYVLVPEKKNTITCQGKSWSDPEEFCTQTNNTPIIVGIILAIAAVCCGGILIWYCKKCKKSGKPKPDTLNVQYTHCDA